MSDMDTCEITAIAKEMAECADPEELVWKVKRMFGRLPKTVALEYFARVMTAELPHPLKAATWRAIRYSHIWWGVDDVLKGEVMDNPLVRRAFADAVPMRRRAVELRLDGWEDMLPTLSGHELDELLPESSGISRRQSLIAALVRGEDIVLAEVLRGSRVTGSSVVSRVSGDRLSRVNREAEMNRFLALFFAHFRMFQKSFKFADC